MTSGKVTNSSYGDVFWWKMGRLVTISANLHIEAKSLSSTTIVTLPYKPSTRIILAANWTGSDTSSNTAEVQTTGALVIAKNTSGSYFQLSGSYFTS